MKNFLLAFSMLISLFSFAQRSPEPFRDGDKIVFAGNSITEAGFYEMYIWQYYQLHFPGKKIIVMNGGIGGDVAQQILDRLDDDIQAPKPTVVVMSFGMNDSRYFEYLNTPQEKVRQEAVAASLKSYRQIEQKLLPLKDTRTIIMTSSPYDETLAGKKNHFRGKYATMQEIAKFQQESAKQHNWAFVDLMKPMTDINIREQERDSNFTLTGPDRIHPGNAGHFAMAWLFLKSQGLANNVVADVSINARNAKIKKAENCVVSNVERDASRLLFDYKPNSLPFPKDDQPRVWENPQKQSEALAIIPFTEEFNQEILTVSKLRKQKKYALLIDGQKVGEWNGDAFARGINLATITSTPQYKQAEAIAALNLEYRELEQKLRAYYWLHFNFLRKKGFYFNDSQEALDLVNNAPSSEWAVASKRDNYQQARKKEMREQWTSKMNAIVDEIYRLNQPVTHKVVIEEVQ